MDAQEPIDEVRRPERRKGPKHARSRRPRGEKRRRQNAYSGPERRHRDTPNDHDHAGPPDAPLSYTGPERRAGAERRENQRRSGADRREGASWSARTDLRTVATRARLLLSAFALSVLAGVGSYTGTYRVMQMLFVPDVVTPIAAPAAPGHEIARVDGALHPRPAGTSLP